MVRAGDDLLELLLPGASEELQRRAVALTTFARLLAADARDVRSPSVALTLDHASRELERDGAERRRAALRDLLAAHVEAALRASSFLSLRVPDVAAPELWRRLLALGGAAAPEVHVPLPGEGALDVAARLLAAAARAGFDEDELALWRVRLDWAAHGARAVEGALEAGFARASAGPRVHEWLAARVECALERGAVRRARHWLEQHAAQIAGEAQIAGDDRLARLEQWTRVALGETPERPASWGGSLPPALPLALAEWRDASPAARPFLAGRAPSGFDRGEFRAVGRLDAGASVLAVIAVARDGSLRCVFRDVAAALAARFERWLAGRDGATCVSGAPEARVTATARRVVLRRSEEGTLRDALDPGGCEALVVEPVLDRRGEVAGWLWLELEHRLIPSSTDLASAAGAWSARVLDERERALESPARVSARAPGADAILARCFEALVGELAMKTAQRRWWGFAVDGARLWAVAEGGAELGADAEERGDPVVPRDPPDRFDAGEPERARILERVLRTRGWVAFDEPASGFSVHPASASGAALAIECGGTVRAVLAIESARRRDFRPADLERWGARTRARAADFAAALFRAWHRTRHGGDAWLDEGPRLARRHAEIAAAARCRAPVAIVGPPGSGRRLLARWLHFERHGAAGAELEVFDPAAPAPLAAVGAPELRLFARGRGRSAGDRAGGDRAGGDRTGGDRTGGACGDGSGGTLLVPHAEALTASQQAELARALASEAERDAPARRVVVTLGESPAALAARGAWSRELAERFAHLEVRVEPLAARRVELPGLLAVLLERFGEREGRTPPRLGDDALALLWRREWRRNLRELESVAYRLVVVHGGAELDAAAVAAELARMGLDAPRKLASRQAEPGWIVQALETTRHASGGVNKTRAAAYLGWDPDTLVSRMRDCGSDPGTPPGAS